MTPLEQRIKSAEIHVDVLKKYTGDLKYVDTSIYRFDILPSLLNRMLEICSSILLLARNQRFKTMEILGRSAFECYVQTSALIQYPESCNHYALFEVIKEKKTAEKFKSHYEKTIASGTFTQMDKDLLVVNTINIKGWDLQLDIMRSLGTTLGSFKASGKPKPFSTWYGNYFKRQMNLRDLCKTIKLEGEAYELYYGEWSKSSHSASASMNTALKGSKGELTFNFRPESEISTFAVHIIDFARNHSTLVGLEAHKKFNAKGFNSIAQEIMDKEAMIVNFTKDSGFPPSRE